VGVAAGEVERAVIAVGAGVLIGRDGVWVGAGVDVSPEHAATKGIRKMVRNNCIFIEHLSGIEGYRP
jgi:hypothetical protein